MSCDRARLAIVLVSILCLFGSVRASAQTAPISKDMQTYCVNDYKKFCGDYGLQTKALSNCMFRNGKSLAPACINALVKAGQVSQAQVDKLREQAAGR